MTLQQIIAIAEELGIPQIDTTLSSLIKVAIIINPTYNAQQIEDYIVGQLKHQARTKVSWFVDIIWPFISSYITAEVVKVYDATAVPTTEAAPEPGSSS
jgi:hypothetical protein